MPLPRASRPDFLRTWLIWTAGFIAFPLAGLAGTGVAGRVDSPLAAVVGGAVAGLVLGVGQTLASRGRLDIRRWAASPSTSSSPSSVPTELSPSPSCPDSCCTYSCPTAG